MNDETILILGIILLGVGAIIGALTYHLIVYRFSNKIEKQLDKSIKNYENFVLKKAKLIRPSIYFLSRSIPPTILFIE